MTELRDFYSALVDSSDDAIVAKDTDGIIIAWNPAAERLFGWTAQEIIGKSIRRLLPDDLQHQEDEILARIRSGERVGQFLTKRLHKDGELIDVSINVSPVRDAAGTIIGASKIARNAGPFLRDQDLLRRSEERFRMLADNISQFVWTARPDGDIYWYNRRWFEYTGTTLADMVDWGWRRVHHPDHVDRVVARIQHSWDTGEEWEDTFPLLGADGRYRWFLSRAVPLRDADGNIEVWFGTNTDITEEREQAEQIRLLLGEVNHRSKNMLATIQAIARRTAPEENDFLAKFERRLAGLAINQDVLVGRAWREIPLRELVDSQLSFLSGAHEQLRINGDGFQLRPRAAEILGMALHELATNSLKYGALSIPEGTVDIVWHEQEDGALYFSWREQSGPPVAAPVRTGFGTSLIVDVPRRMLPAEVSLDYHPDGVEWVLVCSTMMADADELPGEPAAAAAE